MPDFPAIARWPDVPACYGWLSLDQRGTWRLQGEKVTHHGLLRLLNRQYACDDSGNWFVQNGPQRVFVDLAYTPWVFRLSGKELVCHTGQKAGTPNGCYLDEEGNILLQTCLGVGLLDDRDLSGFLDDCCGRDDVAVNEENWLKIMSGECPMKITWNGIVLTPIRRSEVSRHFNFHSNPHP